MTEELYAPEHLHALFQSAFNGQDIEAIVALYETAAVLVHAGSLARGTDDIRAAYRRVFTRRPRIELNDQRDSQRSSGHAERRVALARGGAGRPACSQQRTEC